MCHQVLISSSLTARVRLWQLAQGVPEVSQEQYRHGVTVTVTFDLNIKSLHSRVQVDVHYKLEDVTSRRSRDITFMRTDQHKYIIHRHCRRGMKTMSTQNSEVKVSLTAGAHSNQKGTSTVYKYHFNRVIVHSFLFLVQMKLKEIQ